VVWVDVRKEEKGCGFGLVRFYNGNGSRNEIYLPMKPARKLKKNLGP
jgi:hypothetical protein